MSSFLFPSPSPQPFSSEDLGAARQALGWAYGRGWLQHWVRVGGWALALSAHRERGQCPGSRAQHAWLESLGMLRVAGARGMP